MGDMVEVPGRRQRWVKDVWWTEVEGSLNNIGLQQR